MRGIPFRIDNRVEWAVPSMLPDVERHGPEGVLFLDEITSAPPSVSAAAYQLILDRRLGAYEVPAGWAIFAAGNRQGDRGRHLHDAGTAGQPLFPFRGRGQSRRLGELGLQPMVSMNG